MWRTLASEITASTAGTEQNQLSSSLRKGSTRARDLLGAFLLPSSSPQLTLRRKDESSPGTSPGDSERLWHPWWSRVWSNSASASEARAESLGCGSAGSAACSSTACIKWRTSRGRSGSVSSVALRSTKLKVAGSSSALQVRSSGTSDAIVDAGAEVAAASGAAHSVSSTQPVTGRVSSEKSAVSADSSRANAIGVVSEVCSETERRRGEEKRGEKRAHVHQANRQRRIRARQQRNECSTNPHARGAGARRQGNRRQRENTRQGGREAWWLLGRQMHVSARVCVCVLGAHPGWRRKCRGSPTPLCPIRSGLTKTKGRAKQKGEGGKRE
eukprot:m.697787 g.697787  ORF g.697787 m.697787 type:complete len:328 (+) comp58682_c0_seq18:724-1707(+)